MDSLDSNSISLNMETIKMASGKKNSNGGIHLPSPAKVSFEILLTTEGR